MDRPSAPCPPSARPAPAAGADGTGATDLKLPTRVVARERALRTFPRLAPRWLPALWRGDPLADATVAALHGRRDGHRLIERGLDLVEARRLADLDHAELPAELVALLRAADAAVDAADRARLDRACELFARAGSAGGLVLGLRSLVTGYAAPAGNKPLALSGRLQAKAQRRLAETGRFVQAVGTPGSVWRRGDGFRIAVHVRLMHAAVRRLCLHDPRWDGDAWGLPINQHDMAATVLLFSEVFTAGLRIVGLEVSRSEGDDYVHLWRTVGAVLGVELELLPHDEGEAAAMTALVRLTQGPADADARALTRALLDGPLHLATTPAARRRAAAQVALAEGMARTLLGERMADELQLRRDATRFALPLIAQVVAPLSQLHGRVPALRARARRRGEAYWRAVVGLGLGDEPARFVMPGALAPARAGGAGANADR